MNKYIATVIIRNTDYIQTLTIHAEDIKWAAAWAVEMARKDEEVVKVEAE